MCLTTIWFSTSSMRSPRIMLTRAYSIRDKNTNTVQLDMKTSIAWNKEHAWVNYLLLPEVARWFKQTNKQTGVHQTVICRHEIYDSVFFNTYALLWSTPTCKCAGGYSSFQLSKRGYKSWEWKTSKLGYFISASLLMEPPEPVETISIWKWERDRFF